MIKANSRKEIEIKRGHLIVWLIMFGFFVVSFVTNILGPIIPHATKDRHVTLGQAKVLPFAFFIAYIVSIPAKMEVSPRRRIRRGGKCRM